ncbi:MAG: AI-2E family transporter [Candidatus Colwellbacteria bacterium]|nr:AI-2E family transporter [Candidatus Colwellbacteria bacterium]
MFLAKNAISVLLLAIFISAAIDGLVVKLESWRIPRLLGTIIVFLGFLSIVAFTVYTVLPMAILELKGLFGNLGGLFGQLFNLGLPSQIANLIDTNLENAANVLLSGEASFIGIAGKLLGGVTSFMAVLVLSFYLTLSRDGVGRFLRAIFPENLEDGVLSVYYRSKKKIGRWFHAQLVLGIVIGFLVFTGLWVLGVKYSLAIALFAAIFELVPIVGPIFAGSIAVVVGLSESLNMGIYVLLLFLVIQQLENHVLVPLVMKRAIDIHPVVILVAILAGLEVAGFVGVVLSVPVAVVVGEIVDDWVAKKARSRENLPI